MKYFSVCRVKHAGIKRSESGKITKFKNPRFYRSDISFCETGTTKLLYSWTDLKHTLRVCNPIRIMNFLQTNPLQKLILLTQEINPKQGVLNETIRTN